MVDSSGLILLIEGSMDRALQIQAQLRFHGITNPVYSLPSGEQAIRFMTSLPADADPADSALPQLVLLNLRQEAEANFEFLRWMEGNEHKPVMIVLAEPFASENLQEAFDLGANHFHVNGSDSRFLAENIRSIEIIRPAKANKYVSASRDSEFTPQWA